MNYKSLHLRDLHESDAEALTSLADDRDLWLMLRDRFPHPYGLSDAEGYISYIQSSDTEIVKAIQVDDAFVGVIGVILLNDVYSGVGEVGYWIGKAYWSKGIVSGALKEFISFSRHDLRLRRIEAGVFSSNPASMKVLEKCGFKKEGIKQSKILKAGQILDEHLYGLVLS